jgi:hypothetical protein
MPTARKKSSEKDPCWDGYKQVGEKKSGKEVPNYVPGKKKEIAGADIRGVVYSMLVLLTDNCPY